MLRSFWLANKALCEMVRTFFFANKALVTPDPPGTVCMQRTFYSPATHYEQSLDVWTPLAPQTKDMPLVVLVVGSGFLGHNAFLYRWAGLFNSLGPRAIARQGSVCVAIRHRGAAIKPPSPTMSLFALALTTILTFTATASFCDAGLVFLASAFQLLLWQKLTCSSATYEDMLADVACALRWVHDNRQHLHCPSQPPPTKLMFGGYSSGAHVAASLLQRTEILEANGLPQPSAGLCDSLIFLSGVFATFDVLHLQTGMLGGLIRSIGLTDAVFRWTFVNANSKSTSPLRDVARTPRLPHILIGCYSEAFGIAALEQAFGFVLCEDAYASALKQAGVPVRASKIDSNHFGLFIHPTFAKVIGDELRRHK